jgi:D-arginine dehydrogenase
MREASVMVRSAEVVIVGGGVAGLSLAWALAERGVGDVVVLEREEQPAHHATGRSAASLIEIDPIDALQALKAGGAPFLRDPPPGFTDVPLLARTGILWLSRGEGWRTLAARVPLMTAQGLTAVSLTPAEAAARVPALDPASFDGGLWLPDDGHLDVHALLTGYTAGARRAGAEVRTSVEVAGVVMDGGRASGVTTTAGETIRARRIVNAAGAWAGTLARMAGAAPIPITPRRRSIATFAAPDGVDPAGWPLTVCDADHVYFAPESGGLMLSPMDETPTEPCDARADDTAIAAGFARLGRLAPSLEPRTLRRRWAGLRSFAPDRMLVVGDDPLVPGFFWLAGQGGCGIETSPLVARVAADLIVDGRSERFDTRLLAPARFAGG